VRLNREFNGYRLRRCFPHSLGSQKDWNPFRGDYCRGITGPCRGMVPGVRPNFTCRFIGHTSNDEGSAICQLEPSHISYEPRGKTLAEELRQLLRVRRRLYLAQSLAEWFQPTVAARQAGEVRLLRTCGLPRFCGAWVPGRLCPVFITPRSNQQQRNKQGLNGHSLSFLQYLTPKRRKGSH
jgi:hypothetical protein